MPKYLLIKNADTIVTFDNENRIFTNAHILIKDNEIVNIGNFKISKIIVDEEIDATELVLLPGFINTHHHFFQSINKCVKVAQNLGLSDWLIAHYPIWEQLNIQDFRKAVKIAITELLLSGCTTTVDDLYIFPQGNTYLCDIEIEIAQEMGIRFHFCRGAMSFTENGIPYKHLVQNESTIIKHDIELIEHYHDSRRFSMIQILLGASSAFSVSPELLKEIGKLAKQYNVRRHTHLTHNVDEIKLSKERFGKTPLEYYKDNGWLENDVIFTHGVGLNADEIKQLASYQSGMVYCASSNMRLGQGISPIIEMKQAGIPISLGVDGSASNDSSNILHEIRTALLLQRAKYGADSMTAIDILKIATLGGARIIGRHELGSLAVGKAADIIGINLNKPEYAGIYDDKIAGIVFCASHYIDFSTINGVIKVNNGSLIDLSKNKY